MFRMKSKVRILSSKKNDGRYNTGIIIGVQLKPDGHYMGYISEKEYISRYSVPYYAVAFIDVVTKNGTVQWFGENELERI